MENLIAPDETLDELGSFKIIQKKNGYRFSNDSVQLADFILPLKPADSVIDLGTGSGVIPLILAQKSPVQKIVGIEIQESLANLAKRSMEVNDLTSRIMIIKGDMRTIVKNPAHPPQADGLLDRRGENLIPIRSPLSPDATSGGLRRAMVVHGNYFREGSFTVVVSNPPYTKPAAGRESPLSEKVIAKMEIACSLMDVVKVSRYLVAEKGRIVYIYPASRLGEMLSALQENKLEIHRLKFIHPKPGSDAKRYLIEVGLNE